MPKHIKPLIGMRFGSMEVIAFAGVFDSHAHWKVVCDCGAVSVKCAGLLTHKTRVNKFCSQECPLLLKKRAADKTRHGNYSHPLFAVWSAMRSRCNNRNHIGYPNYGGRGVAVCARWDESFTAFVEDMGSTWRKGLCIDRIDNDQGYSPDNCQWTTRLVNNANRRNSVCSRELIDKALSNGISVGVLRKRIQKGMTPDLATTLPPRSNRVTPT
jgi:hypothetical protein